MSQASLQPDLTFNVRVKKRKKILWSLGIVLLLVTALVFFISYKVVDTLLHHPRDTNVSYGLNIDKTPYEEVEFKSEKMIIRLEVPSFLQVVFLVNQVVKRLLSSMDIRAIV